jgi:hypothetical protein
VVVDAVLSLDQDDLNEKLIGVKKVTGGGLQDSLFVNGVAFKKTFSYAGFEQQPKSFKNPKVVCLNVELELKSEKDNAEVRVEQVSEYQAIVDAEWQIIFNKMEAIHKTGAKVVLSKLPIGDLATQYVLCVIVYSFMATFADGILDTLLTETSSVLVGLRQMIWNVLTKLPDPLPSQLAQISRIVISEPADRSKRNRSVGSVSISSPSVQKPRHVPLSSVEAQSSSLRRWSAVYTTPL